MYQMNQNSQSSSYTQPKQKILPTYFILTTINSLPNINKPNKQNKNQQQPIRICTQYFNKDLTQLLQNQQYQQNQTQKIMEMYLYTSKDVYYGSVCLANLNKQLNWNQKFFQLMKKSLNGKNKNTILQFNTNIKDNKDYATTHSYSSGILRFSIQFAQSSIRLLIFQAQFTNLHQNPLKHAKQMLRIVHQKGNKKLNDLRIVNRMYETKLQKIEIISKQYLQQHQFEINQIKDKFVNVANDVKKKLRPHFGIQDKVKLEQQQNNEQSQTQTRTLYRIKGPKLNKSRSSQNFQKLFD